MAFHKIEHMVVAVAAVEEEYHNSGSSLSGQEVQRLGHLAQEEGVRRTCFADGS